MLGPEQLLTYCSVPVQLSGLMAPFSEVLLGSELLYQAS